MLAKRQMLTSRICHLTSAFLLLTGRLFLGDGSASRSLSGAGVRMGALSADGQATSMPQATIGPDIHQPFNVHLNAFAKIAFDLALRVNNASNSTQFVFAQITDSSF